MIENIGSMYDLRFNINYYGADYPIDSLIKKLEADDIYISNVQRQYVWNIKEASSFIESILLGLPVPTIFLARDKYSHKLLIIDGQQRLKTLLHFIQGHFPEKKQFKLRSVIPEFNNKSFKELSPKDQLNLLDFTIHAIIIAESGDSNRMYYLFERLNTTGTPLKEQEIRNAIYHGDFNQLLKHLSTQVNWLELYGPNDNRLKNQELILRFFALHFDIDKYKGSMKDFLNVFMLQNRMLELHSQRELSELFNKTIEQILNSIGLKAFVYQKTFNASFFDVVMQAVSNNLSNIEGEKLLLWHKQLKEDTEFGEFLKSRTTSKENILRRLDYANHVLEVI